MPCTSCQWHTKRKVEAGHEPWFSNAAIFCSRSLVFPSTAFCHPSFAFFSFLLFNFLWKPIMGQSKVIDNDKTARRQSWIPGSPLFSSLFSSSPPLKKPNDCAVHRSHSFNEHTNAQRPTLAIRQHSLNMDRTPHPLRSKSSGSPCSDTKDDKRPQPQSPQQPRPCTKKSSALANILYKAKQRHHRRSITLDSVIEKDVEETDVHEPVRLLDKDEYEADKSQLKNDFMNLAFTE